MNSYSELVSVFVDGDNGTCKQGRVDGQVLNGLDTFIAPIKCVLNNTPYAANDTPTREANTFRGSNESARAGESFGVHAGVLERGGGRRAVLTITCWGQQAARPQWLVFWTAFYNFFERHH